MEAFATYQDLEKRLHRTFSADEQEWITTLLEDASAYLRDEIIGMQVYPQTVATFTARPASGEVQLSQQPVVSVESVLRAGAPVPYTVIDESVVVDGCDPVDITFTFGYASPPDSLVRWACVLVSQTLTPLEMNLGLTVGGLSSVALDDFKASFADGGESTGMQISDRSAAGLRKAFNGDGTFVVGSR